MKIRSQKVATAQTETPKSHLEAPTSNSRTLSEAVSRSGRYRPAYSAVARLQATKFAEVGVPNIGNLLRFLFSVWAATKD